MIAGLILSAGRSERMGRPKALLPYAGTTFLGHIYSAALESSLDEVRIVLGHDPGTIVETLDLPLDAIVLNENYGRGMLSSLQEGLRELLPLEPEAVVMMLVDHPRISFTLLDDLIKAYRHGRGRIVIPVHGGRRGHPVLFASELFDELLAAPLEVGARQVVRANPELVYELPVTEGGILEDIDTPQDFGRLEGQDE
jgi:molybdenum cofactor cytidylyltransferase